MDVFPIRADKATRKDGTVGRGEPISNTLIRETKISNIVLPWFMEYSNETNG